MQPEETLEQKIHKLQEEIEELRQIVKVALSILSSAPGMEDSPNEDWQARYQRRDGHL